MNGKIKCRMCGKQYWRATNAMLCCREKMDAEDRKVMGETGWTSAHEDLVRAVRQAATETGMDLSGFYARIAKLREEHAKTKSKVSKN